LSGSAADPYVPGLKSSAYRPAPNWSGTCRAAIASTAALISPAGMLGSKTFTFGPKSGAAAGSLAVAPTGIVSTAARTYAATARRRRRARAVARAPG
jgi:hypothetical protein